MADGFADIVVGADPAGPPKVTVFSGRPDPCCIIRHHYELQPAASV